MFIIKNMPFRIENDGKPRYLFYGKDIIRLDNDIDLINTVLFQNINRFKNTSDPFIPPLNYVPNDSFIGPINYTFLWLNDPTPSGKKPKYIYTVYFNTFKGNFITDWGNNTFGEIYYLQNGEVGKAKIVIWRNKILSVAHIRRNDSGLYLSNIKTN